MKKALCLSFYPPEAPSVRHRISCYRQYWAEQQIELVQWSLLSSSVYQNRRRFGLGATALKFFGLLSGTLALVFKLPLVGQFDYVILHREIFPLGGGAFDRLFIRLARRAIFDVDDAIWLKMPLSVDQRSRFWDPGRFKKTLPMFDSVVAGNHLLAEYAQRYNSAVEVIPTSYDDLGGRQEKSALAKPVIVWVGNVGNSEYLQLVAHPLKILAKNYDFVFRIIGSLEIFDLDLPGVNVESVLWGAETEAELLRSADIGIMPLYDRDYERGKCAFKIIQYFSAGLPVVASPIGINAEVVTEGENGYLANDESGWVKALSDLLEDQQLRQRLGRAAYEKYQNEFTREINAERWLKVLQ